MIIPSEDLLFLGERKLPSGTVLYERHGNQRWTTINDIAAPTNLATDNAILESIILPTAQTIEVILVGGCGSLLCSSVDI